MLSRTLKRFMRAADSAGEADYPVNLAKSLDLLGPDLFAHGSPCCVSTSC